MDKDAIMQETRESLRVAAFNAKHPVGSEAFFLRADGNVIRCHIRSAAVLDRELGPVVRLIGIGGPKSIDRIVEVR